MGTEPINTPLIAVVGATASGKSALAARLAQKYGGEIICADSRTIYRGMDIGTAKPSRADREQVPHHLLDIVEPDERFNASDFKKMATKSIKDIHARAKLPILAGGSGLYIDALLFDFGFAAAGSPRSSTNPRHLDRTVQVQSKGLRPNTLVIGLRMPQELLHERITARTEQMIQEGLEEEARDLSQKYGWGSEPMKSIGYRQWHDYFTHQQNKAQTIDQIISSTKQYAKRQMTWFKRNKNIVWVKDLQEADKLVEDFLAKFDTMSA